MKKRIIGSAVTLGAALSMVAGGVAMADPSASNIDPDTKGSITLTKYEGEPGDTSTPLKDVKFTLYKVTGLDVTDPADWTKITDLNDWFVEQGEAGSWAVGAAVGEAPNTYSYTPVSEQTTGAKGVASWGVGTSSTLDLGVYFIQETGAPANVAEHTLPFLVTVPLANNTDNTWVYDVNVHPKNAVVDIEKKAVDAGPVGVGSNVDWTVTNKVPKAQRAFEDYQLRDVLDSRLTYVVDSSVLKLVVEDPGEDVPLLADTDYELTVTTTPADGDTPAFQTLLVVFTEDGLKKLDDNQEADLAWDFSTTVTSIGDGVIENEAEVLVNNPGGEWTPSPEVSSNWGAIKINKFENTDAKKALSGAVFQVFGTKAAADACVTSVKNAQGTLPAGCADAVSVTRDATGEVITPAQDKFTTDATGAVVIPGLHVGINDATSKGYWLVEIVPPAGFINANVTYPVTVTAGAIADAVVQDVANAQEPPTTLPLTGGQVTAIMVVAAALLGGGAIFLLAGNRKKVAKKA